MPRTDVEAVLRGFIEEVRESVLDGESVYLPNFGTFKPAPIRGGRVRLRFDLTRESSDLYTYENMEKSDDQC